MRVSDEVDVISIDREKLSDPEGASRHEWLLTDGVGGYACGTPLGINTRREHGWLVVATRPPLGRLVLLSKIEETLSIGSERYELATSFYEGAVHPQGYRWASAFTLDPLPTLRWDLPVGTLSRTICRVTGAPGLIVLYQYDGRREATLDLNPLLAYRDHGGLQHENASIRTDIERGSDTVVLRPYERCPPLALRLRGAAWHTTAHWYRRFVYPLDREAGRDFHEDLYSPGRFVLPVKPGATIALWCWAGAVPGAPSAEERVAEERKRLRELGAEIDGLTGLLRRAADAFLVRRGETGRLIVASWPSGAATARDAALALPGICLTTNRTREARATLTELARMRHGGALASRAGEWSGLGEGESLTASLLWVLAVQRVIEATGEAGFLKVRLKDVLFAILDGVAQNKTPGATLRSDGLLILDKPDRFGLAASEPEPGAALIEVQALWANALLIGADVAGRLGDEARARTLSAMAGQTRDAVQRRFWCDEGGYLADSVTDSGRDLTLRPHQLYAVGLPHCLLPADRSLSLLTAVEESLLTPVGLRAAAPAAASQDPRERSAWPFLMGLYCDALIRLLGEEGKRRTREWLKAFASALESGGLGYVSERFEEGERLRPAGEPAHAAAVAELLRLSVRVAGKPPAVRASGAMRGAPDGNPRA